MTGRYLSIFQNVLDPVISYFQIHYYMHIKVSRGLLATLLTVS